MSGPSSAFASAPATASQSRNPSTVSSIHINDNDNAAADNKKHLSFAKRVTLALKEHHREVNAAYKAYYGGGSSSM